MASQVTPLTSNRLGVRNPYRSYALVEIALGALLGLLVLSRAPSLYGDFQAALTRWNAEVAGTAGGDGNGANAQAAAAAPANVTPPPAAQPPAAPAEIEYDAPANWKRAETGGNVTFTSPAVGGAKSARIQVFPPQTGYRDFRRGFESAVQRYPLR